METNPKPIHSSNQAKATISHNYIYVPLIELHPFATPKTSFTYRLITTPYLLL